MSLFNHRSIRFLGIALVGLTGISSCGYPRADSLVPPEKVAEGWMALFNGLDLTGWEQYGDPAEWSVEEGILINRGTGLGWLATVATFSEFELLVEYKLSSGGNSSVYYRAGTLGRQTWKNGYDIQLDAGDEDFPTGSLYDRIKAKPVPAPDDTWHTLKVRAVGPNHCIQVDGHTVLDGTDEAYASGRIGLQMHDPDTTVAFRKVWVRPLGLRPMFNHRDFSGWRVRVPSPSDSPATGIRIEEGAIRLQAGPAYVESATSYRDFHARFRIRTAPREDNSSNSGVFLRGPLFPGEGFVLWPEGLEAQVFNEDYDFTTGGFYHFVKARDVYSQNDDWFWMDVNAVGNRFASWVNGMPTATWVDEAHRFKEGILALQAHDPGSLSEYSDIEILVLSPHLDSPGLE